MQAEDLLKKLIENGADAVGIEDRFGDNFQLYERCFQDFLKSENLLVLSESIKTKDYEKAFRAAHALKGLAGNLGITMFYEAIRSLVESLRAQRYENIDEEYDAVKRELEILQSFISGENPLEEEIVTKKQETVAATPKKNHVNEKRDSDWFIPIIVLILIMIAIFVFLLFNRLMTSYEKNVTMESSNHLVEINYQIKQSIEDRIENDWLITYTIAACIVENNYNDEEAIYKLVDELRELWKVSDIIIYTENGYNINTLGETVPNDIASERIDQARKNGESMKIIESNISYTIPVNTEKTFKGSKIAAVSLEKSMESFLDDMNFSAFGDAAYMYLSDDRGKVISRLTNSAGTATYNVLTLFEKAIIVTMTDKNMNTEDILTVKTPTVFSQKEDYVVSTPIETRQADLFLTYFVPKGTVNKTVGSYTRSMMTTNFIILLVFAACAVMAIMYLNKVRKRQFDSAIMMREHMFDLLVESSSTAFGLFEVNNPKPIYLSSNSAVVTGEDGTSLYKTNNGFELKNAEGMETEIFRKINETLREWDGISTFRSGFILNATAIPPRYFEIQFLANTDDSDKYVGIAQDVTLLHKRETDIKDALTLARQANEAKSRFLSNMSHDIRTPMNAIVNMVDFSVENMNNPEKLREYLNTIRESSNYLLMLINDILDMSRVESGNMLIASVPFDFAAELHRIEGIITPLCEERGQKLVADFSNIDTKKVKGDQLKFSQIVMNLLANAVKFTEPGGVIRLTANEDISLREDYTTIWVTVEDTGMGISAEFIPHVFEPFAREDTNRISGIQGTGLGLSICHSYVEAMGGSIACESEEGKGSKFTVELAFEKANTVPHHMPETATENKTPFIGMRCLICEDNPANQKIAETILNRLGFQVEVAKDGSEGLEMFEKSLPNYYNVIYMDIQMPIMDGYEAAKAIRSCSHAQAKEIPIIAMTANVFAEDVEKAYLAGMNGHIGKPIATVALLDETNAVLHKKGRVI